MLTVILSSNVLFGLLIFVPFSITAVSLPKRLSSAAIVSVLLGKGFCVVVG